MLISEKRKMVIIKKVEEISNVKYPTHLPIKTEMKILKQLRKQIERDWGKRCGTFAIDCAVCQVHLGLTILEQKYKVVSPLLWRKVRLPKKK